MMDEDITLNPENNSNAVQQRQREELVRTREVETRGQQQMQMKGAMGVKCPYCGTINDPEAAYCASCHRVVIPSARRLVRTAVQNSTLMQTSVSRAADTSSMMSAASVVPGSPIAMRSVPSAAARGVASSAPCATR